MTLNVVFTGPAFDCQGRSVSRDNLIAACSAKGSIHVQKAVRPDTNVLVASRADTVKARAAADRGIAVLEYGDFIANFLKGVPIVVGVAPHAYVDVVPKAKKTDHLKVGELETLDVL